MLSGKLSIAHNSRRILNSRNICCRAVHARWCIDVRYGCKLEATSLLQEWVRDVGSKAGLTPSNTRLHSGAIGVPESRLEMEVSFATMADWEGFLSRIPFPEHKAWTQRMQGFMVDASPQWQVYRDVALLPAAGAAAATSTSSSTPVTPGTPDPPMSSLAITDKVPLDDILQWEQKQQQQPTSSRPPSSKGDSAAGSSSEEVVLDWKGEPMRINPGDKLPFKFL